MSLNLIPFAFRYRSHDLINENGDPIRNEKGEPLSSHYPEIPCRFRFGKKLTPPTYGLLDSGADGIVLPYNIAEFLELEMDDARPMEVAGGKEIRRKVSKVDLIIGRGGEEVEINNISVSIPIPEITDNNRLSDTGIILIGRHPVFELYIITFIDAEKRFIMGPYQK